MESPHNVLSRNDGLLADVAAKVRKIHSLRPFNNITNFCMELTDPLDSHQYRLLVGLREFNQTTLGSREPRSAEARTQGGRKFI